MTSVPFSQHKSSIVNDERAVALIEFAFVLPVLVLLYLGSFQLMDAASAFRKVTTTTRAMADLTTQNISISPSQIDDIMNASAQIMTPYKPANGTFRISLINVDNSGNATVNWSRSKNGTALTVGANYTLPSEVKINNVDVIVTDVTYQYNPISFFSLIGPIPLKDRIYMIPRGDSTVALTS